MKKFLRGLVVNVAEKLIEFRERTGINWAQMRKAMELETNSAMQRYYDPAYMGEDRRLPLDRAILLARFLVGKGDPPVQRHEVFALAETTSGITVIDHAVHTIPIVGWSAMLFGRSALKNAAPVAHVAVASLSGSDYIGVTVEDQHCDRIAPPGATLVVDLNDDRLVDHKLYMVLIASVASVRRYRQQPPRWEGVSVQPTESVFFSEPIEIIGRVVRVITEL